MVSMVRHGMPGCNPADYRGAMERCTLNRRTAEPRFLNRLFGMWGSFHLHTQASQQGCACLANRLLDTVQDLNDSVQDLDDPCKA